MVVSSSRTWNSNRKQGRTAAIEIDKTNSNCCNIDGVTTAVVGPVRGPAELFVALVGSETADMIAHRARMEKRTGMRRVEKEITTLDLLQSRISLSRR